MTSYAPFIGDGRRTVTPNPLKHGTAAIRVSRSNARMLIDHFLERGESYHSARGSTVWVIKDWAEVNKVSIQIIEHRPEGHLLGYVIKLIKKP